MRADLETLKTPWNRD